MAGRAEYPTADEIEKGRREGAQARQSEPHAKAVRYDPHTRTYNLEMVAGATVSIHVDRIAYLADATDAELAEVELSPSGGGISWPRLDVDLNMTGLVMAAVAGASWRDYFRSMLGRENGARTSSAKAEAARKNGKKGGRPRKRPSVAEATPRLSVGKEQ